jgi:hypothetical protein
VTELVLVFAEVMGLKNVLIIYKGLREFVQSLVQKRKEQIELVLTPWDFRSTQDPLRATIMLASSGELKDMFQQSQLPVRCWQVLLVHGRVMDVLY